MATAGGSARYLKFTLKLLQLQSLPIVVVYLCLIALAPLWIRNVAPLGLKKLMIVYNFMCSISSLYAFTFFVRGQLAGKSMFEMKENPLLKYAMLVYLITKYIELLDTVIMILRHRTRQISFLHVFHHASILILADLGYNYYPWPATTFLLSMNSLIHVFLYLYYGQAALSTEQKPSWRRYLTIMQIVQFLLGLVHCFWGYLYHGFCIYGIMYGLSMLFMFSNFYYQAFIRKRPEKSKDK